MTNYLLVYTTPFGHRTTFSIGEQSKDNAKAMATNELIRQGIDHGEIFQVEKTDESKRMSLGSISAPLGKTGVSNSVI